MHKENTEYLSEEHSEYMEIIAPIDKTDKPLLQYYDK